MPGYQRVGEVPRKAHSYFDPGAGRLAEELVGQQGFSGASSLLYHRHSPSAILSAEVVAVTRELPEANVALEPLHLRLGKLDQGGDRDRPGAPRRQCGRDAALRRRSGLERVVPQRRR